MGRVKVVFYRLSKGNPFKCGRCRNRATYVREVSNGGSYLEPVCHVHRTYYLNMLKSIEEENLAVQVRRA
jgi:hypothetical protein